MKLTEALAKLKGLKSQLARVEANLMESAVHFEDAQPEYTFSEERPVRGALVQQILDLKTNIQTTNVVTKITLPDGEEVSLARLILINANLRSELAHLNKLLELSTEETSRYSMSTRTRETIKKVYAEGYSKKDIRSSIDSLELVKQQYEAIIASVNLTTNLVEA